MSFGKRDGTMAVGSDKGDGLPSRDSVVEAVREDLLCRSQHGIVKYGTSLDRTDLSMRDWLQHAYEEALDFANYLKRAIMELENGGQIKD